MYEAAEEQITKGLSPAARFLLGTVAGLFGLLMLAIAPGNPHAFFAALFALFCLLISLACFTRGRARQFLGSLIGGILFLGSLVYLCAELTGGPWFPGSRAEPSVTNAVVFLLAFGVPGMAYALKARFGLKTGSNE